LTNVRIIFLNLIRSTTMAKLDMAEPSAIVLHKLALPYMRREGH
jgi:hypothetical protein